ncbi:hypothetical protein N658DRAFT_489889 [Parathielavia hyrcaniae]|uniref:Uncharacterized protein n=1 Tax=Parathielavia hyrcaniae TaxID=113614 RepID=A0AAN6PRB7_9PEZI|nr:hypothetical protein N658DRAFT_489889 [Parathielavia hyrcaniae]
MSPPVAVRNVSSPVSSAEQNVRVLLALSLSIASLSVMATLSAMYWLILLLIRSDFLKSLVFVVFPIVSFAWGSIPSDSVFCQISGFTLAVGIESSDVAVLLIALHSAMYIFRPRSGLYPYRRFAYLAFYLYPVLAASLAFVQGNGYENTGHFCYLRTDRSWKRLALSWIPRYMIFAGIVVIYAFIYFYIRRRMGDYGRRFSEAMHPWPSHTSTSTPPVPRLCYNGLIPSTPSSRRTSEADTVLAAKACLTPSSSTSPERPASSWTNREGPGSRNPVLWEWAGFSQAQSSRNARLSADEPRDPVAPNFPELISPPPAHTHGHHSATTLTTPEAPPSRQALTTATTNPSPPPSGSADSTPILLPPPPPPATKPPPPPPTAATATATATANSPSPPPRYMHPTDEPEPGPPALTDPQQQTNRKATLRQLRALFIYPLVYAFTWLFPFVSHVLGHDDDSRNSNSPRWLLVVSLLSLCVQGAVDCGVFGARETPWRLGEGGRFRDWKFEDEVRQEVG